MKENLIFVSDKSQLFSKSYEDYRENAQNLIQTIDELTNRQGLIIYDSEDDMQLIFNPSTFIERFNIINGRITEDLIEKWISKISEIFFLNWENNLIVNGAEIKIDKKIVVTRMRMLFLSSFFKEDLKKVQEKSWPAVYVFYRRNKETKKLEVSIELFKNQVEFNIEEMKIALKDMEEGGELCGINLNGTFLANSKTFSDSKYQFKCNKKTNLLQSENGEVWMKRIKTLIGTVSSSNSIYREMFNFNRFDIDKSWCANKILFKLNKIIEIKYPEIPYKLILQTNNRISSWDESKNYELYLNIKLYDKKTEQELLVEGVKFYWTNKEFVRQGFFGESFNSDETRDDFAKIAIKKLEKINKAYFYKIPNAKVIDLWNFVIGMLKNVSFDFDAQDLTENLNQDLKTAECYFKIKFRDYRILDVQFSDNETLIHEFDIYGRKINTSLKTHTSAEPPHLFNKEKTVDRWKKIIKILRKDFKNVWSKWDRLREITHTIKHLMEMNYGEDFSDAIQLITIHKETTTLTKTFEQKMVNEKLVRGFNFLIIFHSYNFKFEINNFDFQIIKARHSNRILFLLFWDKVINIVLGEKSEFKKNNYDLFWHVVSLLYQVDYINWEWRNNYDEVDEKNIPFIMDFITNKKALKSTIKINLQKSQWELTGGVDNRTEKIKT